MINYYKEVQNVVAWTKEYFHNTGVQKAVVGVSGGIDSAVTLGLCVKAFGKENVLCAFLPCESDYQDEYDAKEICNHYGVECIYLDLEESFNKWWKDYRQPVSYLQTDGTMPRTINRLVKANAKARFRMTTLYAMAGHIGGLVVGTTNKTEALLGYATKYGDGGVDLEPLMAYYKTEIFELAKALGLPEFVISKAPSAGLWAGQTDEGELGMRYADIDRILPVILGETSNVVLGAEDSMRLGRLEEMIAKNKHKDLHLPHYER